MGIQIVTVCQNKKQPSIDNNKYKLRNLGNHFILTPIAIASDVVCLSLPLIFSSFIDANKDTMSSSETPAFWAACRGKIARYWCKKFLCVFNYSCVFRKSTCLKFKSILTRSLLVLADFIM